MASYSLRVRLVDGGVHTEDHVHAARQGGRSSQWRTACNYGFGSSDTHEWLTARSAITCPGCIQVERESTPTRPSPAAKTLRAPEVREPDNQAALALARHIADHPVSTIQTAFRYLGWRVTFDVTDA